MKVARNLLQGAAGGLLAGSVVGVAEAGWLIARAGAPDLWSPGYAWVLYGVVFGLPLGVAAGVAVSVAERWLAVTDARAFALGASGAILPLGAFILRYIVDKEVYADRGVPLVGDAAIFAVLGALLALVLLVAPILLRGPAKPLLKGPGLLGAWGAVALVGLLLGLLRPGADPRQGWAHGKPVPDALAGKPNVLWILVDTLRADHLGAYGGSVRTPNLDSIAADGVVFEQAFAQASWTRASSASMLTSRIPSGHAAAREASRLPDEAVTYAEVLQQGGVTTGALINNINLTESFNFDQGFDTFVYEAPAYRFGATESVFGLALYKVVHKVAEKALGKRKEVERFYQPADVVLGDAKGFVGANRAGRWSLLVHLMEPHDPYFEHPSVDGTGGEDYNGVGFARAEVEEPASDQADYLKKVYAGEVELLDRELGPFLAWLKAEGLYDDLVIVVTADHGEEFGEHGGFWHGTTLYDEQIHVPLVVKLPQQRLAGARVPWQVRSIDIAPTVTTALGLAADPSWEGHDLVADVEAWLTEEEALARAAAEAADLAAEATPIGGADLGAAAEAMDAAGLAPPAAPPAEEPPAKVADPCAVDPRERVVIAEQDFEGNQLRAVRTGGLKYIRANVGNPRGLAESELYRVAVDPAEQNDLAAWPDVCGKAGAEQITALDLEMGRIIAEAKLGAASGGEANLSAAECERLKTLGYLEADAPCGE